MRILRDGERSPLPLPADGQLVVDPNRDSYRDATGIYVRAVRLGRWGSHDIATLELPSLVAFLTSAPFVGVNSVLALLGHSERVCE